jgi:serralysin
MAKPTVSVVNASGNQDIDGILWGWKWGVTNITYSFPTSSSEPVHNDGYVEVDNFAVFNTAQGASGIS